MGDSDGTDETPADGEELDLLDVEEVPLSDELESGLESFVLIEDWDLATSRAETLDVMVDGLRELEDDAAIEEWVAQYGDRDFHLAQERDGRLVISDVFPVSGVVGFIPRSIVRMLSTELLLQDEEKMVGHLIRAHELPVNETAGELGDLVGHHATLHAVSADEEDDADDEG